MIRRSGQPAGEPASHPILPLFLLAEGGMYAVFLTLDLWYDGTGSVPVKYLSIALCAGTAIWSACRGGSVLTAWALAFTLGADAFLLLLNQNYLAGVLLFLGAQACYALRLSRSGSGLCLGTRGLIWAVLMLTLWCSGLLTPLTAAVSLYLSNFLINLWLSRSQPGLPGRQLFWGLALYFCCDLWVGIFNCPELFPSALYALSWVCMWLFYLPGQVLLVLSGLPSLRSSKNW